MPFKQKVYTIKIHTKIYIYIYTKYIHIVQMSEVNKSTATKAAFHMVMSQNTEKVAVQSTVGPRRAVC